MREREGGGGGKRREREERESLCVCVTEREREREREQVSNKIPQVWITKPLLYHFHYQHFHNTTSVD